MTVAANLVSPPLGLGRVVLLAAASLLLHALVVLGLRERLIEPRPGARPTERRLDVALIQEAVPAAPASTPDTAARKQNARRTPAAGPQRPRAAGARPAPSAVRPGEVPAMPARAESPDREVPGVSEAAGPAAPEAAVAASPAVLPQQVAAARAASLALELGELGGAFAVLPASGSYVYKAIDGRYAGVAGTTTIDWQLDAATRRYESRLRSTLPGGAVETATSSGSVGRFGLAPERYVAETGTYAAQSVYVDWERRLVTFGAGSEERPAHAGMQDPLSFLFQLIVAAQQVSSALQTGAIVALEVAGPRGVDLYQFLVVGNETVATDSGAIEAVKLDRARVRSGDARIEVWLAPARGYLPVRLRVTDASENVVDGVLERFP